MVEQTVSVLPVRDCCILIPLHQQKPHPTSQLKRGYGQATVVVASYSKYWTMDLIMQIEKFSSTKVV